MAFLDTISVIFVTFTG